MRLESFVELSPAARARSLAQTLAERPPAEPLWVFAYGSLLWRPCFRPVARRPGVVRGYRRGFCVWTVQARGTPEHPGLGLGLEPGAGRCAGALLGLGPAGREAALAALWERELLTGVYRPRWLAVESGGQWLTALAFVVDRAHPQYAGPLDLGEQARRIAGAAGRLGTCYEYLAGTVSALEGEGIADPELHELLGRVERERNGSNHTRRAR